MMHQEVVPEISRTGVHIHLQDADDLEMAATISAQEGILTGDALILAAMRRLGLSHLATNDEDFERISGLVCYFPR